MNQKEWEFVKQLSPVQKIAVDLTSYPFSDPGILAQKVVRYVDRTIELHTETGQITLTKSDLLMCMLAVGIDPKRYEFFYNKHILTEKLTNKGGECSISDT